MTKRMGGRRNRGGSQISRQHILQGLILALFFVSASTFILVYKFSSDSLIDMELGNVAPENILSPRQITYTSEIETVAAKERARNSIPTIYSRPNPRIARNQIKYLRDIFDYLDTVRTDEYGSLAEKSEWVAAISGLSLTDIVIDQIIISNNEIWAETRQEALAVLNQVMRNEIKDNELSGRRRQLPALIALDTPDEQADVIVAIVEDLIKPNTFPDIARTEVERQAAADNVKPYQITIEENELIISAGAVVSSKEMEALQAIKSIQQSKFSWMDGFVTPALLTLIATMIISAYLAQYTPKIVMDRKRLILLIVLLLLYITLAKIMISGSIFITYLYPIAALSMVVVTLIDIHLAFVVTTIMAFFVGYIAVDNQQAIIVHMVLSGWTGALALGRNKRVKALFWAGLYVGVVNTVTIFIFSADYDVGYIRGILLLEGLFGGILSAALALFGLFIIGNMIGITTSLQLLDLDNPTHPLLHQLLLKTPGTYHHSLMVGNLSEQAAERIGADALLVRVMAYYHDVGKMHRPYFFIENQPEGISVHKTLEPQVSAQIIISHVPDGLDMAKKYRLPVAVKAGISEHHGDSMVRYFYYEAMKIAEEKDTHVNEADFRYPGPNPQTKETGILMLADSSESAVRAVKPGSAEEIDDLVQKIIADKLENGHLDECPLTIADLHNIRVAFVDILQGVHHPRIKYPSKDEQ